MNLGRRWSVPALGLAAAVLFGYVVTHRYHVDEPAPPPSAAPAPAGLPRVTGDRAAGPDGLRVLVSGGHPQVLDTATGRATAVAGLRLAAGERVRLRPVPAGTVATVTAPATSRTRTVLLPRGGGRPVLLGEDVDVVPALRGTDLYVSSQGPGGTSVLVTERTGAVRAYWAQPGKLTLLRDTAAGLVASQRGAVQGTELRLLDPRTGAERRRLATGRIVLAAGPISVAHVSGSCSRDCPVTVTPLAGGRPRDYSLPAGAGIPAAGEFSPDQRWLALAVPGQYRNGRLTVVPGFAQVLDLRTGAVTRVPGVQTAAERRPDVGWYGDVLVLGVWSARRGQLAVWSPHRPASLQVLPAEPPGDDRFAAATVLP